MGPTIPSVKWPVMQEFTTCEWDADNHILKGQQGFCKERCVLILYLLQNKCIFREANVVIYTKLFLQGGPEPPFK